MTNAMLKYKICARVKGTASSRYLLALLIDLCNEKGEFTVSINGLRLMTGFCAGTVYRNMRQLKENGYIRIVRRTNCDGGRASNQYVLDLENLRA